MASVQEAITAARFLTQSAGPLAARGDEERRRVAIDSARVYVSDAADRIAHSAKQIVSALAAHRSVGAALGDASAGSPPEPRSTPSRRAGESPMR